MIKKSIKCYQAIELCDAGESGRLVYLNRAQMKTLDSQMIQRFVGFVATSFCEAPFQRQRYSPKGLV